LGCASAAHGQQRPATGAAAARRLSAQSSYEALPRSENCTNGYRTTSVRYTVVGSQYSEGNPPHLVLEEKTSIEQCENLEGPTTAEVAVVARPARNPAAQPLWTIRRRGEAGGVADEFPGEPMYRLTEYGCCGSENLDTYYSLATGRRLFTADHPLLFIDAAPFGTGLVAVHDVFASDPPPGAANERTLIAAVSFGGTREPGQRVLLRGPTSDYRVFAMELVARGPNGQVKRGQNLGINDELTAAWSVAVVLELEAVTGEGGTARVEIPIENGRLAVAKARVPAGFRVVPEAGVRGG
ncbi:MAG TPA: hypothetical protein VJT67_03520, partial [Longimicrobiaceae bacterium]|nr:hypothetical protein [Longimicrobiaceae bacterium]